MDARLLTRSWRTGLAEYADCKWLRVLADVARVQDMMRVVMEAQVVPPELAENVAAALVRGINAALALGGTIRAARMHS